VWIKQPKATDDSYRALHGRKPASVQALFRVTCTDLNISYNLALVSPLNPVDSGYIDPHEGLPWVEMRSRFEIVDIAQIRGAAQLIPGKPDNAGSNWENKAR
jgi:hypothetical protein